MREIFIEFSLWFVFVLAIVGIVGSIAGKPYSDPLNPPQEVKK